MDNNEAQESEDQPKGLAETARLMVGTCFGLGYAPIAPGTAGALLGVVAFVLIVLLAPAHLQRWLIGAALLVSCYLTVVLSPWAERHWKKKDPGNYVLDEVAGFLVTVLLFRLPDPSDLTNLGLVVFWAFMVTRAIDIIKPPPARQLEALPQGWGILLDDIASSLYAAGLLHVGVWLLPAWFGF